MGNTVSDFKEGRVERYRDRLEVSLSDPHEGDYWFGYTKPDLPKVFAVGSLSRCVDKSNGDFKKLLVARNKYPHLRNFDVGGPLAIEKTSLTLPTLVDVRQSSFGAFRGYSGVFFPDQAYKLAMSKAFNKTLPPIPLELGTDRASLRTYGSTAIAKSIPDIPEFSLFRFIGELRAGLPQIPLRALAKERKLRNAGGEYLNVQFGILPTVSDLEKLFKALENPALRLAVKRKLNEEHRVRKVLDKGSTYTKRSLTATEMNTAQGLSGNSGYEILKTEYRIWSSISFVYQQVNELDRLISELDQNLGGLGAMPTGIDIWNLTAWSWLIDWFVNFNHVITSLSYLGRDGLRMQRGYVMASYSTTREVYQIGRIYNRLHSTTGISKQERKYRIAASPFGFGYTWKDFDPFQLSILGALGISRLRF